MDRAFLFCSFSKRQDKDYLSHEKQLADFVNDGKIINFSKVKEDVNK